MTKLQNFFDKEFLAFCQQEFDKSRRYLKTCGKPKNEIDLWFIGFHKETCKIFKEYLK